MSEGEGAEETEGEQEKLGLRGGRKAGPLRRGHSGCWRGHRGGTAGTGGLGLGWLELLLVEGFGISSGILSSCFRLRVGRVTEYRHVVDAVSLRSGGATFFELYTMLICRHGNIF